MGIDSMEDLLEHEAGLARYCCHSWFRLISAQKHKGHTHEQEVSELWREVQTEFEKYFPGVQGHNQNVVRKRGTALLASSEMLQKQAHGCLATVLAQQFGKDIDKELSISYLIKPIREHGEKICFRARERAIDAGIKLGLIAEKDLQRRYPAPDFSDWVPLGQPLLCSEFND